MDQPFAPEPEIPLWKKLAVPGALVAGAAGALGVYHATSATSSHRLLASQTVVSAAASGGARGVYAEGNAASENTAPGDGDVIVGGDHNHDNNANADMATDETAAALSSGAVMREYRRQLDGRGSGFLDNSSMGHAMLEGVATGGNHGQVNNAFDAGENDAIGGGRGLAEEFRRLSEAMEHQTGQLVQAVGAMKTLASRAEQDSSSLLAARVNNHTSELRAELGTIKQLLLLQAGGGGGGAGAGAGAGGGSAVVDNAVSAVTASVGTVGATVTPGEVASTASDDSSARVAGSDGPSGKDEKRGASAAGTPGEASGVNEGGKGAIGGHDQSSRRAVVTARQADGKTAEESEKEGTSPAPSFVFFVVWIFEFHMAVFSVPKSTVNIKRRSRQALQRMCSVSAFSPWGDHPPRFIQPDVKDPAGRSEPRDTACCCPNRNPDQPHHHRQPPPLALPLHRPLPLPPAATQR